MKEIKIEIFVEGVADVKFLEDYLNHLDIKNVLVSGIGGKDELEKANNRFEINFKKGIKNLLIFDADIDFKARKAELEKNLFLADFQTDIFLFPNDVDPGDLETVLENIIQEENQVIFECWNSYETCLRSKKNIFSKTEKYTTPARKTKIYAYLEALLGESKSQKEKIKEKKRDYLNENYWNLNSEYLKPLKEFILIHGK